MRFVKKWSYASANHIASVMKESHQKRFGYYYGFQLLYGELFKGAILFIVAILLGIFVPTLIIFLTFASLRMLAGGYHMDTYGRCMFVSMILFVGAGLIAKYTYNYWNMFYIFLFVFVTFIFGLYAVIRYAPKDTPTKPITVPKEIQKYKRFSFYYLGVWLLIVLLLAIYRVNIAVLSLCFAVLLELFTITPAGCRFFEFIRNRLE